MAVSTDQPPVAARAGAAAAHRPPVHRDGRALDARGRVARRRGLHFGYSPSHFDQYWVYGTFLVLVSVAACPRAE